MTSRNGRAAAYYADQLGWRVFPLTPREKIPAIRGGRGCLDGTTDVAVIADWWERMPSANVGIALGHETGMWCLDIDPRNGGDASLDWLHENYGQHPETVEAITGSGGGHIFFAWTAELSDVRWTPIGPGLDVKGEGGYVVAAPSVHPNGKPYSWEVSHRPVETSLAVAPDWLLERLMKNRRSQPGRGGKAFPTGPGVTDADKFTLGKRFREAGWLGDQFKAGVWAVRCPSEQLHSCGERFDTSTVLFAPVDGRGPGWFFCSHGHCGGLYGSFDLVLRAFEREVDAEVRAVG